MDTSLKVSPERDHPHIPMRIGQEQAQIQASHLLVTTLDEEVGMGVQTKWSKLTALPVYLIHGTPPEEKFELLMKKKQLGHQYP